jgi:hypothetical protein
MLLIPNVIVPDTAREAQSGYDGAGGHCAYAARTTAGETHGCEFFLQPDATHGHFSYLTANIEQMFLTGQPPYDARRTLLTTGARGKWPAFSCCATTNIAEIQPNDLIVI